MIFRADAGFANAYLVLSTNTAGAFQFFKRTSGSYVGLTNGSASIGTPSAGDVIAQELKAVGGTLEWRIWNVTAGGSRPSTPSATLTDSSPISAAGYGGIYTSGANAVDDFTVADTSTGGGGGGGGGTGVTIAPNNAAFVSSPGNWSGATSTSDATVNAGAYKRIFISGACTMTFDVSAMGSPASKVAYRVDGGAWVDSVVSASIAVAVPAAVNSALHLLELIVVSTSIPLNRWTGTPATAVIFTGLTAAAGFTVAPALKFPRSILVYGDSIVEGIRTINDTAANDTDQNDARVGWALELGKRLGVEVGVIGFGAGGYVVGGSGGVPALPTSYNLVYAGVARTFPADLVAVISAHGTNDGGQTDAAVTAAAGQFLTGVLAATVAPAPSIVLLRPLNGSKASAIQAAATASGSGRVFYVDTTGVLDPAYGIDNIGLHPRGPNNLGRIVPALVPLLSQFCRPRQFTVTAA